MAKNIKGITIEIGGNTTKLEAALKNVNKVVYSTNSELKQLNQALKLDPKNTELLAQKQEILKKNIEATSEKIRTLKQAQEQMGPYAKLTDDQKESYRALSVEIAKSENALNKMNDELKQTNKVDLSKIKDGLKKVGDVALEVSKKLLQVSAAVGTALSAVVTKGVKSYADYEQNLGGVETLFKGHADKVIENAKNAYKTAGVSANEYMQGVTSFSASLLQSLGGDTEKAADVADMAFRDMSDNANKFGTDMGSIQNAYQGFAKQNYTMLDNLKLGYGGTKKEMERLLKDAEKFSGVKYDINNLNDVYQAIHVIQEEMDVTGTTAEEAEKTISGSVASMKGAFDNFLNGSGSPEQLAEAITNVLNNVSKAVSKLAPSILNGLVALSKTLIPQIVGLVNTMLPQLLDAVSGIIDGILNMISSDTTKLSKTIGDLMTKVVLFITNNLPKILEGALKIVMALAMGIAENADTLIPAIVDCVLTMTEVLIDNVDLFIDAAIQLIIGLAQGLMNALPRLLEKIPIIIEKLVTAIINNLPKLLGAGVRLIIELGKGLINAIPQLISYVPRIITSLLNAITGGGFSKMLNAGKNLAIKMRDGLASALSKITDVGKNLVKGLWNGISNAKDWVLSKIKGFGKSILNGLKSFFGIHSPSKVMEAEIGVNLGLGLIEGLEDTQKQVNDAMMNLSSGITASVNPTINPTANSNPLILQIENFNNNRESDIQKLAQELEFYRKNSAVAKGGS